MRRTCALFTAAISAQALAAFPCAAQEAQAYVPPPVAPAASSPAQAAALKPGYSVYWSRMHMSGDTDTSLSRANAIADGIIQGNQRRFCGVLFFAAVLMDVQDDSRRQDNAVPAPCR